jgi:hypothetical protein
MVELLAAHPVGADGKGAVLFELCHRALYLTLGEPGGLSKVLFAGSTPAGVLLAVPADEAANAVHDVLVRALPVVEGGLRCCFHM